jgi:hypothetical protein
MDVGVIFIEVARHIARSIPESPRRELASKVSQLLERILDMLQRHGSRLLRPPSHRRPGTPRCQSFLHRRVHGD